MPSRIDVDQCLHNDNQLRLIGKSIVSIVKHYPQLRDELVQKLDASSLEDLVQLIAEKITPNLSEDGLDSRHNSFCRYDIAYLVAKACETVC